MSGNSRGRVEPGEDENLEIAVRLPAGDGAAEIEFAELEITDQAVTGFGPVGYYMGEELSDGRIRFSTKGRAPQGEQDAVAVARVLIRALRELGEEWGDPVLVDFADVDCEARWGDRTLKMQMTKAEQDPAFWRAVRAGHEAKDGYLTPDEASEVLRQVIKRKARTDTAGITLALGAMQTPGFALSSVIDSFRRRYSAWSAGFGFEAVWLVAEHEGFTYRLDVAASK
jgi:hypothetical protein